MTAMHRFIAVERDRTSICRAILDDLPEWFGIPSATNAYAAAAADLPMFATFDGVEPTGFVSLRCHTPFACELHVLGVKRRLHRTGIGGTLIGAALRFAAEQRFRFVTVKTLAPSHPDPHYTATRGFYEAMGFLPIEIFPTLWGSGRPCVMMMRPIDPLLSNDAPDQARPVLDAPP